MLPRFEVNIGPDEEITVEFFENKEEIYFVFPILKLAVTKELFGRTIPGLRKHIVETVLVREIQKLINAGYLFCIGNEWKANTIDLVANKLGYDIRRQELVPFCKADLSFARVILAQCLVDVDGNLCKQFQNYSAELIEWFQNQLDDKLFDEAVEKYKNKMIVDIAGLK